LKRNFRGVETVSLASNDALSEKYILNFFTTESEESIAK